MMLVTVESPTGRATLAVPADVAVEQLLPAIMEACRCERNASVWSLRARGEPEALVPERTLEQSGLYQGSILELIVEEPPSQPTGKRDLASWAEVVAYAARRAADWTRRAARRSQSERPRAPRPTARGTVSTSSIRLAQRPEVEADASRRVEAKTAAARSNKTTRRAPFRSHSGDTDRQIASAVIQRGLLIAVLGHERRAGATTVSALLATLVAQLRADLVAAVDTDSVSASLSLSLTPGRRTPAEELLSTVTKDPGAVHQYLVAGQHGLLVLPAPILAAEGTGLDEAVYTALLAQLSRSAELAIVDCGLAEAPGGRAALAAADVGVVVCRPQHVGTRGLEQKLLTARSSCQSLVAVVNGARRQRLGRGASAQVPGADHTVSLSYEPAAAARVRAATFSWESAPRSWQAEVRALAAALLIEPAA
jgi:hypothetical protein